jgi:rhamnulokinase
MTRRTVLAVDIGAESGRVMAIHFDGQRLAYEEVYRFPNVPVQVRGTLYWDILRLWGDVQIGIGKASHPAAIGIDTWGVDFGFLDRAGHLLGNPVHYRDQRTNGMVDYVYGKVAREEIFARTGIQIMAINSLYQMASLVRNQDPALANAAHFVTVPDLLYYWLTGVRVNEFTISTTTQCCDPQKKDWAFDLLDRVGIPTRLFGEISQPGQILGQYDNVPVVLGPLHDTESAIVAVPSQTANYAYNSSGTWSLLGLELTEPMINADALRIDITNEGGFGGTFLMLKNVTGLWLIQESRRAWQAEGQEYDYDTLIRLASEAPPLVSLLNPDDPLFMPPGRMPDRIRQYCGQTGQPVPESVGALARSVFESLAFRYRYVLREMLALTGKKIEALHIVGGGSLNSLLCQMTADAVGCQVIAGPVEATALGNAIVQLIALGDLKSVAEGRALVRDSFPLRVYQPGDSTPWDAAELRFKGLAERSLAG